MSLPRKHHRSGQQKVLRRKGRVNAQALQATALSAGFVMVLCLLDQSARAAGPTTQFTVTGDITAPQTFNLAGLQALPQISENVTYLSGTTPVMATFQGPSLWYLLNNQIGIRTNAAIKNDILREIVLTTGSDGYQTVLSMGEINPSFGGSATLPDLVADLENGVALTTDGFARTVVPGDIKGGRYVSNLAGISVIHAPTQTGTFSGGTASQFTVTGNVTTAATYNMTTLQALPSTTVTVGGVTYQGVNLWTLLSISNVVTNPTVKNNILTDYVVATGSDGYQAIVSLGEIDPAFGNQPDLIAYLMNGTSLGTNGFARLVVPNDSKQGRWVSNLVNLEVFDATLWVANAGEIADLTGLNINAQGFHLNGGTLTSSLDAGVLTVPTVTLDGGLLDTPVTVTSPNTITQTSGLSLIAGTLSAPAIAINAGTLQLVGGTLNGATNVASGAALAGSGAINGALTFSSGSTFGIGVLGAASDRINVTGAAALAGTVQLTGNGVAGRSYTILSATAGVTGKFGSLSTANFASWLMPKLSYTGTEVDLFLSQKTLSSQLSIPVSRNARSTSSAIDAVLLSGLAPQSFLNLFNLPASALPAALQQISGEAATGAETAGLQAGSSFLNLLLDPASRDNSNGGGVASTPALAYAEAPPLSSGGKAIAQAIKAYEKPAPLHLGWSIWGTAFGGFGAVSGNSSIGSSRVAGNAEGLAVGADFRPDASFVTGFALAGGGTSYQVSNGLGGGSGGLFQAGAFASKSLGAFYISTAAAYTLNPEQVTRSVPATGSYEVLRANPTGQSGGARAELGYRSNTWLIPITPYVAGEAQRFSTNRVNEYALQGASDFGLTYGALDATSVKSELGLRSQSTFAAMPDSTFPDAVYVISSRVAWAHEYDRTRKATAVFEAVSLSPFSVTGAAPASNAALVTAGAELRFTNGFTLFAKADADLAPTAYSVRGNVGLNYTW